MPMRRTAAQSRIDRALFLSRRPPNQIDVRHDPLALIIAAVNECYERAVAESDDALKSCALLLLADIARRRGDAHIPGSPIELAHVAGRA
jgi:hypothetical protein